MKQSFNPAYRQGFAVYTALKIKIILRKVALKASRKKTIHSMFLNT